MGFTYGVPKKLIERLNEIEIDTHYYDTDVIPSNQDLFTFSIDSVSKTTIITGFSQENVEIAIVPYKCKYGSESSETYANVTSFKKGAFKNYTFIKNITIPNTIHNIPDELFCGCELLYQCNIPKSVNSIGSKAFYDCINLDTLFIGPNVKEIASDAFTNCDSLDIICYKGSYAEEYAKENNISYSLISYTLDKEITKDSHNLVTSGTIYNKFKEINNGVLHTIDDMHEVNTIYDIGIQSNTNIILPYSPKIGSYIQVDFYSGANPTNLTIAASGDDCLSDIDLIPESNTMYTLYFDYGVVYYDEVEDMIHYGWRFSYAEYPHMEV